MAETCYATFEAGRLIGESSTPLSPLEWEDIGFDLARAWTDFHMSTEEFVEVIAKRVCPTIRFYHVPACEIWPCAYDDGDGGI